MNKTKLLVPSLVLLTGLFWGLFNNLPPQPVKAAALTATPTPSATRAPLATATLPAAKTVSDGLLPASVLIEIKGHAQRFSIDCEAAAAVDLAGYYGIKINEFEFQSALPLSDNPDIGFVGSLNGEWGQIPPAPYGVHAEPVAELLTGQYGFQAKAVRRMPLGWVKQTLNAGDPIIAWVIGRMEQSPAIIYTDKQGRQVTVAPYEHVVILQGYDDESGRIHFMSEGVSYTAKYETFLSSWKILGNMALVKE